MPTLSGSKTEKNLMASFAGESQARNRYTFYAGIAEKEGYVGVSAVFLETADNEKKHAHLYFQCLEGNPVEITAAYPSRIGNTLVNLEAAAEGEKEEWTVLYPTFGRVAEEEGFAMAAARFRNIASVEAHHEARYRRLFDHLRGGTLFRRDEEIRWKCLKCGHIHVGMEAPECCPVCAHPQGWFVPEAGY
jgi:rubrerythrin